MKNNLKKSELLISPQLGVYSNLYKDIYFNKNNGIKETQHNFLKANNLAYRFKKSDKLAIFLRQKIDHYHEKNVYSLNIH